MLLGGLWGVPPAMRRGGSSPKCSQNGGGGGGGGSWAQGAAGSLPGGSHAFGAQDELRVCPAPTKLPVAFLPSHPTGSWGSLAP